MRGPALAVGALLAMASCFRPARLQQPRTTSTSSQESTGRPAGANDKPPVVYKLRLLNVENSGVNRHDYGEGMPKARVVASFVERTASSTTQTRGAYIQVELVPLAHARLCQCPLDLTLEGTGLGAWVSYFVNDKHTYLPDHMHGIPLDAIRHDLLRLSRELGSEKPAVEVSSHSYLGRLGEAR